MEQHIPQGGRKQQQHDDTANLVLQFINEEISVDLKWKPTLIQKKGNSFPSSHSHSIFKYNAINITCNKSQRQYPMKESSEKTEETHIILY